MGSTSLPHRLTPPTDGRVDLLIVAGEHSGDEHAARMVRELRAKRPQIGVCALGGPRLAAAGAQLLTDLTMGSTMGFAVLKKVGYYFSLIAAIVRWVEEHRPRAVCFIDSSGLNLRIAKRLFEQGLSAKAGGPTKTLYYISPQIWASRAKRRFAMAQHLDGVATIFPFEAAAYADTALPVQFVGHPFLAPDHVSPVAADPAGPVLLLPGSRRQLVARIFPVLLEAHRLSGVTRAAVVLYPSDEIRGVLEAARPPPAVRLQPITGGGVLGASAVLTVSGTMSMQCALAGIPGALAYKTDVLTYFLGRRLVQVSHIGIANLLLGEPMYPEYIQNAATAPALAAELRASVEDPARRARTAAQAERLRALLDVPATGTAADWLARHLA